MDTKTQMFPLLLLLALHIIAIPGIGISAERQATLLEPLTVPAGISEEQRSKLEQRQASLMDKLALLRSKLGNHRQRCSRVSSKDTVLVAECSRNQTALLREIDEYNSSVNEFQATLEVAANPPTGQPAQTFIDSSVVDLRDARTLTVDPAKVKGGATQGRQQQGLEFMTGVDQRSSPVQSQRDVPDARSVTQDLYRASLSGDKRAQAEGLVRLIRAAEAQIAREQAEHQQVLVDMRILRANGQTWALRLEGVKDRVRQKELAGLQAASLQWTKEKDKLMDRMARECGPAGHSCPWAPDEADRINFRLHQAQVAAVRQAKAELDQEVRRLKEQLIRETNGNFAAPHPDDRRDLLAIFENEAAEEAFISALLERMER